MIKSFDQAINLLNAGLNTRAMASQNMNQTSSRSHIILLVTINQKVRDEYGNVHTISSKLTLVDLAGSERVRKSTSV
jgi:hypothetical protein